MDDATAISELLYWRDTVKPPYGAKFLQAIDHALAALGHTQPAEPAEFWVVVDGKGPFLAYLSDEAAYESYSSTASPRIAHVREVRDGGEVTDAEVSTAQCAYNRAVDRIMTHHQEYETRMRAALQTLVDGRKM